jgi:hypothetical protein
MIQILEFTLMLRTISGMVSAICTLMMLVAPISTHSFNSRNKLITRHQPTSELSLCNLNKNIGLYQNKVVRVRAAIMGMGGHYPFFVAATGCNPHELIVLHVKFHNRERAGVMLQNRIDEVLKFNLANDNRKAEAIIIGRVKKKTCNGCSNPEMLISVMDVEMKMPASDGGA